MSERTPLLDEKHDGAAGNQGYASGAARHSAEETVILDVNQAAVGERRARDAKVLVGALCFCLVFMIIEFGAGIIAHSLALLTDAVHLLTDVGSYSLSLGALFVAGKSACSRYNYGWHRAEVLGTLFSVFTIYALVVWIVFEAVVRLYNIYQCSLMGELHTRLSGPSTKGDGHSSAAFDPDSHCRAIDSKVMMIIGVLGLLVNVVCASILYFGGGHGHSHSHSHSHSHGHGEPNKTSAHDHGHSHGHHHEENSDRHHDPASGLAINAALLHALGDCVQSLGVIFAGSFIYFANKYTYGVASSPHSLYNLADPLCSILFAAVTLRMTTGLLRDLWGILMETTPGWVDYQALESTLLEIEHVESIHDLHVWSLSSDYVALSAHLVTNDAVNALRKAQDICRTQFDIDHTTFQVDNVESGNTLCPGNCKGSP